MSTARLPRRRLSAADFERLRPFFANISAERIQQAHRGLVLGESWRAVAESFGCTRQSVGDAISRVWEIHERELALGASGARIPSGWAEVTLFAPVKLIERWQSELANLEQVGASVGTVDENKKARSAEAPRAERQRKQHR